MSEVIITVLFVAIVTAYARLNEYASCIREDTNMPRAVIGGYGGSVGAGSWAASAETASLRRQLADRGEELDGVLHRLTAVDAGLAARHIKLGDVAATGEAVLAHRVDPSDTLGDLDFIPNTTARSQRPEARLGSFTVLKLPEYSGLEGGVPGTYLG